MSKSLYMLLRQLLLVNMTEAEKRLIKSIERAGKLGVFKDLKKIHKKLHKN